MRVLRPGVPAFGGSCPLLVVRGRRSPKQATLRAALVGGGLLALSLGWGIAMRRGLVPWVGHPDVALVPMALGPLAAAAAFFVLFRSGHAASGEAALHDEGAVFAKEGDLRLEVPWSAISAYRDGATAFVQLESGAAPPLGSHVAIPTPTEADRVAVLAFLDGRGLKRLG